MAGMSHPARGADAWSISIGVRETGDAGAIGSDGSTSGPIEWVTSTSPTLTTADGWKQFVWNFGTDAVSAFTGDGILNAPGNRGVLEHIRIVNSGGNSGGELRLRIDDIVSTINGNSTLITGFEGFGTSTANDTLMFREPLLSPSTSANMSTGPNGTLVSTLTAASGTRSLAARWTFVPNGNTSQWLRLTTNNAATFPDPVIDIGPDSTLSIWLNMRVYQPTGDRVRGIDVSSNQGIGIDWNRVAQPASAGGAGMSFAFVRATRGGTSGTSGTGAMRVDDSTYAYNIAGAKAAGLLTGPYHFGRPDRWTPDDAIGLGNAPGSIGTPEDEARHYLQVAGSVMKPGYLRPVYDLEDGNEETNNTQLTNFVLRFNETITKYKGPSAKLIIYSGTTYANSVDEELSQFPLWMPRFQVESDWTQGDVFPGEASYGVWGDGDPDTPLPWSFWQYYSPDVYIPGVHVGTHNDINVAHGDINFVRQFLVQGAIWDGSSDNQWTTDANWDSGAAPAGSTEVLLDTPIAGNSTIALSGGRSAGGLYFADNYTLAGGSLTLTDGRIDVDPLKSAVTATDLSAPNGFRKVGQGTLTHSAGASDVTGIAQVLQGTMNVTGGSIAVSGDLLINPELTQFDKSLIEPFPASAAEITSSTLIIDGGVVTAAAAYIGGNDSAPGAIGTLNISSGSLTVPGVLKIWNDAVPMVDSRVNLSGGVLSVGSLDTSGDVASLNWTGGTLAVTGAGGLEVSDAGPLGSTLAIGTGMELVVDHVLAIGGASSPGTLNISGGTVTGTSAIVSPLGFLTVDAGGTLAAATTNDGLLTLNGGTVTAALFNNATMNVTGATVSTFSAAATVDNPGVINVNSAAGVAFNAGVAGVGTINVAAGASMTALVVASRTLNVNGMLTIAPGSPSGGIASSLSVGAGGRMDVNDTRFIVFGGDLGSFSGGAYTGITGLIADGRAGGAWDGNGIMSSTAAAADGLTSLGIAMAEHSGHAGGTFGGVPVSAGDVLILYTYAGDATLDGKINIDDYGRIDGNIAQSGVVFGWFNGDFNYDGKINIDDYGIIDGNINRQGTLFSAGGGVAFAAVEAIAAVPEPVGLGALCLSGACLRRRRRP